MASLRVHRENGVNVSSLHIKQSAKKNIVPKQFIEQTDTYIAKAIGSSYETFETYLYLKVVLEVGLHYYEESLTEV